MDTARHRRPPRRTAPDPVRPLGRRAPRARLRHPLHPAELTRLVQLTAEVLAGERDPRHLAGLLAPRAYREVSRRVGAYRGQYRPRVVQTWVFGIGTAAAEAGALVALGPRHRALALRLAARRGHWTCTHVEGDFGRS
ncbi:Rv3235 family protein [Nocardiopsis coralliicola]